VLEQKEMTLEGTDTRYKMLNGIEGIEKDKHKKWERKGGKRTNRKKSEKIERGG
jgi:hypothetical protein